MSQEEEIYSVIKCRDLGEISGRTECLQLFPWILVVISHLQWLKRRGEINCVGLAVCLHTVSVCGGACSLEMVVNDSSVDQQVIIKVVMIAGH